MTAIVSVASARPALAQARGRGPIDAGPPISGGQITPIRPPAVPLIVRQPYVSLWQSADALPGHWPSFWTGAPRSLIGMARIDGKPYVFMGDPQVGRRQTLAPLMTQASLQVTPTQSVYTFEAAGVQLTVDFLSPFEPQDLRRQSVPFGYLFATAHSTDGHTHPVSLFVGGAANLAVTDGFVAVRWDRQHIGTGTGSVTSFSISPAVPRPLTENRGTDTPNWGQFVLAAADRPGMTIEAGAEQAVYDAAMNSGALDGSFDSDMPRPANERPLLLAFNWDLGQVGAAESPPVVMVMGDVREPAVSYLGKPVPPLWKSYWPDWRRMLAFFCADAGAARQRADEMDRRVTGDATKAGGQRYAALCAIALRQAVGATELVGTSAKPWMFMKEISSDGNISTVDVVYPAFPVFLYANPNLLRLQLEPLFDYAETGGWPKPFAEHDIGSSYPNASGHNNGNEEDMPVEETANMLIMAAAYMRYAPAHEAQAYARQHYRILKQWADYEVQNGLDPANQNQTDDFTGFIAHSANLALKGILGVGAMGQIAGFAGRADDAAHYSSTARDMIGKWAQLAQSKTGDHLTLAYGQDDTWSLKYNAFPDKVLGLNLVPQNVLDEEAKFYMTKLNEFGVPLDNRHTYTKTDWEVWTAASTDDAALRQAIIDGIYKFADTSSSRDPFTDWYDTVSGQQVGFRARPVIGGVFAILDRTALKAGG